MWRTSRFPHFNEGALRRALEGRYEHWPVLGGHRRFSKWAVERAVEQLLNQAGSQRLCLMCSESRFEECHRHSLLTPIIVRRGWTVLQINRSGGLTEDRGPRQQSLL